MNHKVHSWSRGCLTLKFSGSWKTVTVSPEDVPLVESAALSPSGEMGMVSRGTGDLGIEATSAIIANVGSR